MNSKLHSWMGTLAALAVIVFVGGYFLLGGNDAPTTNEPTKAVGGSTSDQFYAGGGLTSGGGVCTLTDANGGTYTLTDAELSRCGTFEFAAGGAGQAAIALTMPATSTMVLTIPNAGDCRGWKYDASALAAGTTTTMTLGTGHNIIAYTTNDDVIDGNEFSQITMCRRSNGNVNTFVTEMLNAD